MGGAEQLPAPRLNLVRREEAGLAGSERFELQSGRLLDENGSQAGLHDVAAHNRSAVSAQESAGSRPNEGRQLVAELFRFDQLRAREHGDVAEQDGAEVVDYADRAVHSGENGSP